jgi:hypothetical protein
MISVVWPQIVLFDAFTNYITDHFIMKEKEIMHKTLHLLLLSLVIEKRCDTPNVEKIRFFLH